MLASPAVAQRVAMDTMSLHRLPGVFVEVDAVSEEARRDGFNSDSIRELIADKLADARIKVLGDRGSSSAFVGGFSCPGRRRRCARGFPNQRG